MIRLDRYKNKFYNPPRSSGKASADRRRTLVSGKGDSPIFVDHASMVPAKIWDSPHPIKSHKEKGHGPTVEPILSTVPERLPAVVVLYGRPQSLSDCIYTGFS